MENEVTTKNTGLKYGLYLGIALMVFDLILYVAGLKNYKDPGGIQYVGFLIAIGFIVAGMLHYRNNNQGLVSYGQCIGIGSIIGLIAGVIIAVYLLLYFGFIDPEAVDLIREGQKEKMMENPKMTEEAYENAKGFMEAMTSPTAMAITSIISYLVFGLITSLIAGLFIKKS